MIQVLTTITRECSLLSHFLRYYLSLGVDRIVIAVHPNQQIVDGVKEISRGLPVVIMPTSGRHQSIRIEGGCKEELRLSMGLAKDAWIIPADLDEFYQFPDVLKNIVAYTQKRGELHQTGVFSDRIAEDGTLPPDRSTPSIWEQYPLEADITQKLVRGNAFKVVLSRGDQRLGVGHHYLIGVPVSRPIATIHHFKWRAGIVEALAQRVQLYRSQNVPWWGESDRTLEYLQKNNLQFQLEDFKTKPGWRGPEIPQTRSKIVRAI